MDMRPGQSLKFVIVGHVDHGKSTLIGRLLFDTDSLPPDKMKDVEETSKELGREVEFAFIMDHLKEEREQGITIETTQIFFKTPKQDYVIIDAPGHVEFVKNMITGASQADAALLIIDVQEQVREQTRRHAYILSMLGLDQLIVVLNKMDLVKFKKSVFKHVRKDAKSFLKSIDIQADFYIPICAINGDNITKKSEKMSWYNGPTVLECIDLFKNRPSPQTQALIFPIQDVYKIEDKRIAVGRVEAGVIQVGQTIKILPSQQTTKIDTIEKYGENPTQGSAGESLGITTESPLFLERGQVICEPGKEPSLTHTFSAHIFWMSRQPFHISQRLVLRCATQEVYCSVDCIKKRIDSASLTLIEDNSDTLQNLEVGEVVIKTEIPIAVETFNRVKELGRFVLVQDQDVCSGGIITSIGEKC